MMTNVTQLMIDAVMMNLEGQGVIVKPAPVGCRDRDAVELLGLVNVRSILFAAMEAARIPAAPDDVERVLRAIRATTMVDGPSFNVSDVRRMCDEALAAIPMTALDGEVVAVLEAVTERFAPVPEHLAQTWLKRARALLTRLKDRGTD